MKYSPIGGPLLDYNGNPYIFNDDVPETYEIVCSGGNNCSNLSCSVSDNHVSMALSGQSSYTAFATFAGVTSTGPGTKQISCNLPNTLSALLLGVYDAPPFITGAKLSAPLIPGGATVTLSIFGQHFGNSQGNGTLGVCSPGATPCNSTPDISFGSIIDWGCSNPAYCQIDVPITAQSTANGTYDLVVNAAGAGGSGFVGDPDGSQQRAISINRGRVPTQTQKMITIYLLHGINQVGGAMNNLKRTLTSSVSLLDQTRYVVDAGFDFGECAAAGTSCAVSRFGDTCSVDAGGKSLARYIGANPPPGDIVLIGYSMGGLIARDMIANNYLSVLAPSYTGGRVAGLITLGTPHLGYPWDPNDDNFTCPLLNHDLAGGWEPLLSPPVELPPIPTNGSTPTFFDRLRQSWGGTSVPYWLAAAGTVFTNSTRSFPPNLSPLVGGCIYPKAITLQPGQAYSDGVVCRDSALYQEPSGFSGWASPPFPTEAPWQDPAHQYVHTFLPFLGGQGLLFGVTAATPVFELYNPPFLGSLVATIVSTLNAH